jgi:hypothetical protein
VGVALAGELDGAPDVVVGDAERPGLADGRAELLVALGIEAVFAGELVAVAGAEDEVEVLLVEARAGDEAGDLLLLGDLPLDEVEMSGWSRSRQTILAARRVVPPT